MGVYSGIARDALVSSCKTTAFICKVEDLEKMTKLSLPVFTQEYIAGSYPNSARVPSDQVEIMVKP